MERQAPARALAFAQSHQGRPATERFCGLENAKSNLYLIEEPTIGLHMADVKRLIDILHRLVNEGHPLIAPPQSKVVLKVGSSRFQKRPAP